MGGEPYSILDYHRDTAHVRGAVLGRVLNRDDVPHPFKIYRETPVFHLSHDLAHPEIALDKALSKRTLPIKPDMPRIIAGVCNLAAGITQATKNGDTVMQHLRSAASAGALYPTELYVAIQNVIGMNNGLYHYNPLLHTMSQLRAGYVFGALRGASPIIRFYLTSIFHRSSWKYGPRGYRYCLLDAGHMVENLRLALHINGLPARVDYDFKDNAATRFLGIDPAFEGCVAQIHSIGCGPESEVDETAPFTAEDLARFSRVAPRGEAPETLLAAHRITSSFARCPIGKPEESLDGAVPLPLPVIPASTSASILVRRSRRNFFPGRADPRNLTDVLGMICRDLGQGCGNGLKIGFLSNEHSGMPSGHHIVNQRDCSTLAVKPGSLMTMSARVCLDQGWLENAAMHIAFSADLEKLNAECGPRAYRYVHLEAGRLGQLAYLAATGKQLGACGVGAFFDDEAAQFLSLSSGEALLYLVAVGPVKR